MITFFSFVFGLFAGSFFGVVVSRLNKKEKGIITGRSHCDHCGYILTASDLIPVFSWILIGGKCRKCKKKISCEHPITEFATGALFGITAYLSPISIFTSGPLDWFYFIWLLLVVSVLWIITLSDIKYMEIPDQISLPSIAILLIISAFLTLLNFDLPIPDIINASLGLIIGFGFFAVQIGISYIIKKDLVGGGDLRLGALMGLILGWKIVIIALFLAYFIGAIFSPLIMIMQKKGFKSEVPFGPYLAFSTFICIFWGEKILHWWLDFTGISSL